MANNKTYSIDAQNLTQMIREMAEQVLNTIDAPMEAKTAKDTGKRKGAGKNAKMHRNEVIAWLNDPSVDCAEIARQLWPTRKEDSRRSYFYKCRDHKPNGRGGNYDFKPRDYYRLYSLLTSDAR